VTTYLLVHGAWHGGWCWRDVEQQLRAAGHEVVAPTLTGLAERFVGPEPGLGLSTHIAEVVSILESKQLDDVVLVGHSYAGMVVTGAASIAPHRLRRLIVLDGFLPEAGERAVDLLPPHVAAHYRDSASEGDGWGIPPRPLANLGVTDQAVIDSVTHRLTPHPLQTYLDQSMHSARRLRVPGTYLLCSGWSSPFGPFAERAERLGWLVDRVDGDHEVMLTNPTGLVGKLVSEVLVPVTRWRGDGVAVR
jgi:pimeloyl-ACP methyl ester carboxylesterase